MANKKYLMADADRKLAEEYVASLYGRIGSEHVVDAFLAGIEAERKTQTGNWKTKYDQAQIEIGLLGSLLFLAKECPVPADPKVLERVKGLEAENAVMQDVLELIADKYGDWTEAFMRRKSTEALAEVAQLRKEE